MKSIKFFTKADFLSIPKSTKTFMPDWYKQTAKFSDNSKSYKILQDGNVNTTIKACSPFLDALTSGYSYELWQDLQVTQGPVGPELLWRTKPDVAETRSSHISGKLPIPAGHSSVHFIWKSPYLTKTPPGYSILLTHPLNRFDLPFTTMSAIVDSDCVMSGGSVPFFVKEGFEGIIPKGTPIFQVLPFKREGWQSVRDESLLNESLQSFYQSLSVIAGWYRKTIWKRKIFKD